MPQDQSVNILKTSCAMCGNDISPGATICPTCKSYQSKFKFCRSCNSQIKNETILCPICKTYQSTWRNRFTYLARIAGIISLIGSAGAYFITEIPDIIRVVNWKDSVMPVNFHSTTTASFNATLANMGDGPIVVNSIQLYFKNGATISYQVNKYLQKGDVFPTQNAEFHSNLYSTEYLYGSDETVPEDLIKHSNLISPNTGANGPCYQMELFSRDADNIRMMENYYQRTQRHLAQSAEKGVIFYYSLHEKKELKEDFPVTALFLRANRDECNPHKAQDTPPTAPNQ